MALRDPGRRVLRWAVALCIACGACALLLTRADPDELWAALVGSNLWLIGLGAVVNLLGAAGGQAVCFHGLLAPLPALKPARLRDTARLVYVGCAANALLPARAGEALRVVELRRRHGYRVEDLIVAHFVAKVVETLGLALLALAILAMAAPPGPLTQGIRIVAALGVALAVATAMLARGVPARDLEAPPTSLFERAVAWPRSTLRRMREALGRYDAPAVRLRALGWSAVFLLADVVNIALCLAAVGIDVSPAAWPAIMICVSVGLVLPVAPANVGVFEGAAVVALTAYGVPAPSALAFALIYHANQVIPISVIGLAALWWHRTDAAAL